MDMTNSSKHTDGVPMANEVETAFDLPRIGKFVQQHVIAIAEFCEEHPDELERLRDDAYCRATLGLNYPLFRQAGLVEGRYESKYRRGPRVVICGETMLFTNDLYARQYPRFIAYLLDKKIIDQRLAVLYLEALPPGSIGSGKAGPAGVLVATAIGNAQNLMVRNILGRIRPDEQSYGGWEETWNYFAGECAYCGTPLTAFDKDHVFSINFQGLGEHKRGNLIPACTGCNSEKRDLDFRTFLDAKHPGTPEEAQARKVRIVRFMGERDYLPFPLDPQVDQEAITTLLAEARQRVEEVAAEYVEKIRTVVRQ